MPTPQNQTGIWRFGVYEVDSRRLQLRRNGVTVKLREQPFRILLHLLEHAGQIVTREDLRQLLWPADTYVDFDHSLNTAVMNVRNVLGDPAGAPMYVETIPRRGYRFVAPVVFVPDEMEALPAAESSPEPAAVEDGFSLAVLPFKCSGSRLGNIIVRGRAYRRDRLRPDPFYVSSDRAQGERRAPRSGWRPTAGGFQVAHHRAADRFGLP